ncbi:hypothetical protein CRYUN_Cryun05aG0222700 [Craigia yunnanensis]
MENAGKMEEYVEEEENSSTVDQKASKPVANGVANDMPKSASQANKSKEGKSVLIKQEEQETGVVSWNVLIRKKRKRKDLNECSTFVFSFQVQECIGRFLGGNGALHLLCPNRSFTSFKLHVAEFLDRSKYYKNTWTWLLQFDIFTSIIWSESWVSCISRQCVSHSFSTLSFSTATTLSCAIPLPVLEPRGLSFATIVLMLKHACGLFSLHMSTAREVKRLDSVTRSPVYAQFGEALSGLPTICAYKAYDRMMGINGKSVDNNIRFTLVNMSSNHWLTIHLETLGELPSEAPLIIESNRPPPGWLSSGSIKFEDVVLRYRPELPPVVHGLSFTISPSDKIGLMDLRKVLGIIQQSPVLFSVLMLSMSNKHNDADLWEALERAHLKDGIRRNSLGLDAKVLL